MSLLDAERQQNLPPRPPMPQPNEVYIPETVSPSQINHTEVALSGQYGNPTDVSTFTGYENTERFSIDISGKVELSTNEPIPEELKAENEGLTAAYRERLLSAVEMAQKVVKEDHGLHNQNVVIAAQAQERIKIENEETKAQNKVAKDMAIAAIEAQYEQLNREADHRYEIRVGNKKRIPESSGRWQQNTMRAYTNIQRDITALTIELDQHEERRDLALATINNLINESDEKQSMRRTAQANLAQCEQVLAGLQETKRKLEKERSDLEAEANAEINRRAMPAITARKAEFEQVQGNKAAITEKYHEIMNEVKALPSLEQNNILGKIQLNTSSQESNQLAIANYSKRAGTLRDTIMALTKRINEIPNRLESEHRKYQREINEVGPKLDRDATMLFVVAESFGPISRGESVLRPDLAIRWGLNAVSDSLRKLNEDTVHDDTVERALSDRKSELQFDPNSLPDVPTATGKGFYLPTSEELNQQLELAPLEEEAPKVKKKLFSQAFKNFLLGTPDTHNEPNQNPLAN